MKLFLKAIFFALIVAIFSGLPNEAQAQSTSGYSAPTNGAQITGYTVLEDENGAQWGVTTETVNGVTTTKYWDFTNNVFGTPTTVLYEVHKHPTTRIADAGFTILNKNTLVFGSGKITSISVTALSGNVTLKTATMSAAETLPLHATVGLSAPQNGDGYRWALNDIEIIAPSASDSAIVTWTND
jgi:hypothetical protein